MDLVTPANFCLVFLLCKMLYFKNDFELEEKLVSDTRKKNGRAKMILIWNINSQAVSIRAYINIYNS